MLQYQHQWELEEEEIDDTKANKVDKNSWARTKENIVLQLKLLRVMRVRLAYVVQHHAKVAHISPGYDTYLNLDKKMIAIAPIVDKWLNFRLSSYKCDTFKTDNALVYQMCHETEKEYTGI